jgi:formylglycine-generating enzyme required for sulfatase activity
LARINTLKAVPLLLLAWAACAQESSDAIRRQAGDCARCHVISVVEWGYSGNRPAGANCQDCHRSSTGHVRDERNNVKPDRVPRRQNIVELCRECHEEGCPRAMETNSCQRCHHVHALVDPRKPPVLRDERLEQLEARWRRYAQNLREGERLAQARQWAAARVAFEQALAEKPGDPNARARSAMCRRRLQPGLAGFEIVGADFDEATGLPLEVRVIGLGISFQLIPGGDFDLGSDQFAQTRPVHRVRVEPFYLARHELTRDEWKAITGSVPSERQDNHVTLSGRWPITQISWDDTQKLLHSLNERVAGGGFRLPTEAEWEHAARAGGESGEVFDRSEPRAIEQSKPDRLGLFDLAGNVREWWSSRFTPYPYDAKDGRDDLAQPGLRVLRGGVFSEPAHWYDPALRHGERPDRRMNGNGLRLARSIPQTE